MPIKSRRSVIKIALLLCRCAMVRVGGGSRSAQSKQRTRRRPSPRNAKNLPAGYGSPHSTQSSVGSDISHPFLFNSTHSRFTLAQPLPASTRAIRTCCSSALWTPVHNFSVLYRVCLSLIDDVSSAARTAFAFGVMVLLLLGWRGHPPAPWGEDLVCVWRAWQMLHEWGKALLLRRCYVSEHFPKVCHKYIGNKFSPISG